MEQINVCRRCNSLFQWKGYSDYCYACMEWLNGEFKYVRNYIRKHEHAGLEEVSEACNVPVRQIIRWVREERLFFTEESMVALPCLGCGSLIKVGNYCTVCKEKMRKSLSASLSSSSGNEHDENHYLPVASGSRTGRKHVLQNRIGKR